MIRECFPYLRVRVRGGAEAIAFYERAFGARERFRLVDPENGRVGHAELELAPGTVLMLSEAYPELGIEAPAAGHTPTSSVHLHVDDADAFVARAIAAGATVKRPLRDQFYGERSGAIVDPFGHEWLVGHALEELPPDEMQRRWNALAAG